MRFVPAPPSIVKTFAPFPVMVNFPALFITISSVNLILVKTEAKFIVSSPLEAFAAATAWRKEQFTPEMQPVFRSSLLVTVKVAALTPTAKIMIKKGSRFFLLFVSSNELFTSTVLEAVSAHNAETVL